MTIKEVTLASVLIALLIAQNYILYTFPITLTYLILYVLAKRIKSNKILILSVFVFVAVKNIIYMALPPTIILDLVGLSTFIFITRIKIKWLNYLFIVLTIIIHILLLDFSTALMTANIFETFILNISTGFITYIYAPLSIILIMIIDGIEIITNYETSHN